MKAEWVVIMLGWAAGWWLLRGKPPLPVPQPLSKEQAAVTISVIIPARNEARNLPVLLASLALQTVPANEILVVDDGSEDGTGEVARRSGATVISPGALPSGWSGKSWACWRGAKASGSDLLIFLDADTKLSPPGLERIRAAWLVQGGALTVQPVHRIERNYERLSAYLNAIVLASVGRGGRRSGAFGPCLACGREDYEQMGGHETVKSKVLDHHALGETFAKCGYPLRNYIGMGTLAFRMYPEGLGQLLSGWAKSFASGASSTSLPRLAAVSVWIAGSVTAITAAFASTISGNLVLLASGLAGYAAYAIQLGVHFRRAGPFGMATAILYPIPLLTMIGVFVSSLYQTFVRRRVTWKGRSLTAAEGSDERS